MLSDKLYDLKMSAYDLGWNSEFKTTSYNNQLHIKFSSYTTAGVKKIIYSTNSLDKVEKLTENIIENITLINKNDDINEITIVGTSIDMNHKELFSSDPLFSDIFSHEWDFTDIFHNNVRNKTKIRHFSLCRREWHGKKLGSPVNLIHLASINADWETIINSMLQKAKNIYEEYVDTVPYINGITGKVEIDKVQTGILFSK